MAWKPLSPGRKRDGERSSRVPGNQDFPKIVQYAKTKQAFNSSPGLHELMGWNYLILPLK